MCDEGFAGEACSRAVPNVCAHNCAGHGACLTNGVCACDAGFYGIGCTLAVAGHQCPRHCSGRGLCGPDGQCICEPGFGGAACERVKPMLEPRPPPLSPPPPSLPLLLLAPLALAHRQPNAFVHLNVTGSSPAPPSSAVAATGLKRGAPAVRPPSRSAGRLAPPKADCSGHCSGHGTCFRGVCSCHTGFAGAACEVALPLCSGLDSCSGHGSCDLLTHTCVCHPGYGGETCNIALPVCPLGCSARGVCATRALVSLGATPLDSERHSLTSGIFLGGLFGTSGGGLGTGGGISAALGVSAVGPAQCECRDGLAPPACAYATGSRLARIASAVQEVSLKAFGPINAPPGTGGQACPLGCSGRGHCRGTGLGTRCVCAVGYGGIACERAAARCPADCNGRGVCEDDGTCTCEVGWTGVECGQIHYMCEGGCGGHGTCVSKGEAYAQHMETVEKAVGDEPAFRLTMMAASRIRMRKDPSEPHYIGACKCAPGFGGERCEESMAPPVCLHNCSGRGSCGMDGRCLCQPGYTGSACDEVDTEHGECPLDCCGHGRCRHFGGRAPRHLEKSVAAALGYNGGRASRRCECDVGFTGADCCEAIGGGIIECPHGCAGRGDCVKGTCRCVRGWMGRACDELVPSACPHGCSGHGECRSDGTCRCERGFSGKGCETGDAYGASSANALLQFHSAA